MLWINYLALKTYMTYSNDTVTEVPSEGSRFPERFYRMVRSRGLLSICKALLGRVSPDPLEQFAKYEDEDEEMARFAENYPVRCGFIIGKILEVQREVEENRSRIPDAIPTIEVLDLSMRSYNCLKRAGLNTVSKVVEFDERDDLSKIRNLRWCNVEEIKEKLWEYRCRSKAPDTVFLWQ